MGGLGIDWEGAAGVSGISGDERRRATADDDELTVRHVCRERGREGGDITVNMRGVSSWQRMYVTWCHEMNKDEGMRREDVTLGKHYNKSV